MLQNISLVATKYKLVSTCIGGTDDNKVEELLGIDGIKETFYIKSQEEILKNKKTPSLR